MPMLEFTLDNLKELDDGRINIAFAQNMKQAVADCMDRANDKKARTVTMTIKLTPVVSGNAGDCEDILIDIGLKNTVPEKKSKTYPMAPRRGGILAFNVNHPEDPGQGHFADTHPNAFKNEEGDES